MTLLHKFIRNKQRKGFSPIILFCGEQRMGKTRQALRLAFDLEGDAFNIREQFFTGVDSFAHAYDKFKKKVLVYDEAGEDLDPYRVMDILNRVFSHIIQTQAYRNNVCIVILPFAIDFGKSHRKHVKAVVYVYRRGAYKLYSTYSWHPSLNESKIRLQLIEDVGFVPLPPDHIDKIYHEEIESQMKDAILQRELGKLKARSHDGSSQQNHEIRLIMKKHPLPGPAAY